MVVVLLVLLLLLLLLLLGVVVLRPRVALVAGWRGRRHRSR